MKLIDVGELVNEIQELKEELLYNLDCAMEMDDTYMENSIRNQMCILQRILGRVKSQEVVNQWIPTNIYSPKESGNYLVTKKQYYMNHRPEPVIGVERYDGKSFKAEVKAWMPLPEEYKEEEQ